MVSVELLLGQPQSDTMPNLVGI